MTNLPRLELTEDPDKNNDYIIYRHSVGIKNKQTNTLNNKKVTKKRRRSRTKKKSRKSRKGFLNIF
jgi:hypothetical protein